MEGQNGGSNSIVNTILILVVIALIIYGFFWYQNRSDEGTEEPNIEINLPGDTTDNSGGTTQ